METLKTHQQTVSEFGDLRFPAYAKLANGQEKLFYGSLNDAYSWSCQQKSSIVGITPISSNPLPADYNPSNHWTVKSHILAGGKRSDFTDEFLKSK